MPAAFQMMTTPYASPQKLLLTDTLPNAHGEPVVVGCWGVG